jgi:hypothetical protein
MVLAAATLIALLFTLAAPVWIMTSAFFSIDHHLSCCPGNLANAGVK